MENQGLALCLGFRTGPSRNFSASQVVFVPHNELIFSAVASTLCMGRAQLSLLKHTYYEHGIEFDKISSADCFTVKNGSFLGAVFKYQ